MARWIIHEHTLLQCVSLYPYLHYKSECQHLFTIVIDPSVQFNWIKKQWERVWISKAEDTVLALVRLNNTLNQTH